jgi:hypothetical protein
MEGGRLIGEGTYGCVFQPPLLCKKKQIPKSKVGKLTLQEDMNREIEPFGGVHVPALTDFWSWVRKAFTPSYQNEVEMYLKDSVDHKDLETRMQVLARRGLL